MILKIIAKPIKATYMGERVTEYQVKELVEFDIQKAKIDG